MQRKFIKVLNSSSINKSIALLFLSTTHSTPSVDVLADDHLFIEWASKTYLEDPEAFHLELLQKSAFIEATAEHIQSSLSNQETIQINDIYHRFLYTGLGDLAQVQMNRITPCTITHIKKYLASHEQRVSETPALYKSVVVPFIEAIPESRTLWIKKVLAKESEQDHVLFHDTDPLNGFVLLPDSKWDSKNWDQLYLLAISQSPDIKSLRDLNGSHIPFLQNLRNQILNVLKSNYNMKWRDVRLLVHYQPSYYHFHVHVINIKIKGLEGTVVGQCHLLEENLLIDQDFYSKKTFIYSINAFHGLYDKLINHDLIQI